MAGGIKLVTVLVACLAIANAVRGPFPEDKPLTYKYVGDVKAGTIQPEAYASEYGISAYLHVKHDARDADHPNSFLVALSKVESGVYNGASNFYDGYEVYDGIPEVAKVIEQPFAIVYDDLGSLIGVRINQQEPAWSKNMKKAIASMFNVDLYQLHLSSLSKPNSFTANEITIYGNCSAAYEVQPVHNADYDVTITKFTAPKDCSDYKVWEFDYVEYQGCDLRPEHSYDMGSRKVFKAAKVGDSLLIKSLAVYGHVNRFLWKGRSEAHYILNNATFTLVEPEETFQVPDFDLTNVALSTDVSYEKLHGNFDEETDMDFTQGRHVLRSATLVSRAEKLLNQAVDYLEENHVIEEEPSYLKGQLMNRLGRMLKVMKPQYFHDVYNKIVDGKTSRDEILKRLFLESVANVGTHASTLFIKDLVMENKLHYLMMLEILGKMPLNVRNPNEELLKELEPMLKKNYFVAPKKGQDDDDEEEAKPRVLEDIAKPVFLSFATLVYRAHKNLPVGQLEQTPLLNTYIDFFYDYFLRAEYDGKVTALQALRNIQIGKVYQVLVPVVKGEVEMEGFSEELRLHAIWAIEKAIPDYQHAYDLLWSIMADSSLPLKVRIAAYDVLVRKATTAANMMQIHWFMAYEKNEQFYNYHYTTLKSLANSVDPCNTYLQELATHCLRFTKIRPQPFYGMSSSYMVDSMDPIYGHGEGFLVSYVAHEKTGFPEVLTVEHIVVEGRRRHSFWKLQVILKNMDQVTKGLADLFSWKLPLNNTEVLDVLKQAKGDYKSSKIFLDIVFSHNGRVTFADNYNGRDHPLGMVALELFLKFQARDIRMNHQFVHHEVNDEVLLVGELGVPVLVTNKVPKVYSIRRHLFEINSTHTEDETDLRFWRHGEYSMATYNPLLDTWHVVQRLTATDIQLPMKTIDISHSSSSVMEGIVFRLPANKHSTAGFVSHAKDSVDLIEGEGKVLSNFCDSCEKHQVVIIGKPYTVFEPESYDSKSLGLRFYSGLFDCENGLSPILLEKESWRTFAKERKNSWGEEIVDMILSFRQDYKNILLSPKMGSCGVIAKVEPSQVFPTSYINYLFKANFDSIEEPNLMHALKGNKVNVRGTYKAFGYPNNETVSTWDLHLDATVKPGYREQSFSLQLTRKVPGAKNLKICVDAQKSYPAMVRGDILKVNANEEEAHAKLTFSMAETDGEQCSRDGTLIQVNLKGQLSEEQKTELAKEEEAGGCVEDKKNELFTTVQGYTPLTPKCFNHAIKYTTLRNYLINIHYAKIPDTLNDIFRSIDDEERIELLPHLVYDKQRTEEGSVKVAVNYSMDSDTVDMSVVTPTRGFKIVDLNVMEQDNLFDPPAIDGYGFNADKYLWNIMMDNSRFSLEFLQEFTEGKMKLCSIYPKALITADSGELPHELSDKWTLASGDYVDEMYAVFVKSVNNVMGVKVFAKESVIEFAPLNSEYTLKINNNEVNPSSIVNGTYVPDEPLERWVFKMTSNGPITYIELKDRPVTIVYTSTNVALFLENELQGKIAGLCGHLDGSHKTTVPKEYHLIHV